MLKTLDNKEKLFHQEIPQLPSGKYAHIIILRKTESFSLFQTDGELNTARVSKGLINQELFNRMVIFKRKQSSPERLKGRELLRAYNVVQNCEYNSKDFCKKCPDCILYGFAIGDKGSEKSKVIIDSSFSVSGYEVSHQQYIFNGLHEWGTMTDAGIQRDSFGEQDHVLPQVFFPSVITLKDPTELTFSYLFTSILKTKRYGAQNTRTGSMENKVIGVIFSDSEIFSNLKLTQTVYDNLEKKGKLQSFPLLQNDVEEAITNAIPELLKTESARVNLSLLNDSAIKVINEFVDISSNDGLYSTLLKNVNEQAIKYSQTFGVDSNPKAKKSK
jgi:CRISPR-associated protein Csc2